MTQERLVNILIAEDDYAISLALKTIVKKNVNCQLTVANNGQEAIDSIKANDFDLILSDWNMPIKTGQDVLEFIRSNEKTQSTPFIMLTARSDRDSVVDAAKTGVTDYIHKPFNREDLIAKINSALDIQDELVDELKSNIQHVSQNNSDNIGQETDSAKDGKNKPAKRRPMIEIIAEKLKNNEFSFPSSSDITYQAIELANDPDSAIQDIADIIKKEVTITTRLIAISNSSSFRGSKDCTTLEDAIKRLGMQETCNYLWVIANTPMFESSNIIFQNILANIKSHSLAVAESAQIIAKHARLEDPSKYYYMGLLHDIGSVLIMQILEDIDKEETISDIDAVHQSISQLHTQFGSMLLKRWKMSGAIVETALHHENPPNENKYLTEINVINVANCVAEKLGYSVIENPADIDTEKEFDEKNYLNVLAELPSSRTLAINENCFMELHTHIPEYIRVMGKLL